MCVVRVLRSVAILVGSFFLVLLVPSSAWSVGSHSGLSPSPSSTSNNSLWHSSSGPSLSFSTVATRPNSPTLPLLVPTLHVPTAEITPTPEPSTPAPEPSTPAPEPSTPVAGSPGSVEWVQARDEALVMGMGLLVFVATVHTVGSWGRRD